SGIEQQAESIRFDQAGIAGAAAGEDRELDSHFDLSLATYRNHWPLRAESGIGAARLAALTHCATASKIWVRCSLVSAGMPRCAMTESELIKKNPTGRFTGLSEIYSKYRPSYPREAIDRIIECCELNGRSTLVDVGCGTGISSRLFAERGVPVVGIEPNAEMRTAASAHPSGEGVAPSYQEGQAESTGLPDRVADAVMAAQAFHWFRSEAALAEFHRILKPGGWVILLWNERDERDEFTAAYGAII